MYWREYRTEAHIAQTYGVSEATVCRTIQAVENALMRSGQFRLPGKKALTKSDVQYQVVVVDATECPGGASQKKQRRTYSGKKKRHTQKAQVVADQKTRQILATAFSAGKTHDFKLFKQSRTAMAPQTGCLADSGYLGLAKHHANSRTPHKRSKHHPLTRGAEGTEPATGAGAVRGRTHHPEPEDLPHPVASATATGASGSACAST